MERVLRVLILKDSGLLTTIEDDVKAWAAYEKERIGATLEVHQQLFYSAKLTHKSFGIQQVSEGVSKELYGLDGVKDMVRPIVKEGEFDAVFFVYDIEDSLLYKSDPAFALDHIANWTYFDQLYPGTPFSEIVVSKRWAEGDPFRVFSHEIRHNFVYRLRALGYPIQDQMDLSYVRQGADYVWLPYYKEYAPLALDGNRSIENTLLSPYLDNLFSRPEVKTFIQKLQAQLAALIQQLTSMKTPSDSPGLIAWATAAKKREGWAIGTTSYRNLNPGNLRYTAYTKSLGAIGKDDSNFCIFATYDAGWGALLQFLRDARANLLKPYREHAQARGHRICTFEDFYQVYAPSGDDNDPNSYALEVAKAIGVPVTTYIDQV